MFLYFTFPYDDYVPSSFFQQSVVSLIPVHICIYFLFPELLIAFWPYKIPASIMFMPEAAIDEDTGPVFTEYNVRAPGKASDFRCVYVCHNDFL